MKKVLNRVIIICLFICLIYPCLSYANVDTSSISVDSEAALLIHPKTNTIIYEKNAYKKMYPASTTKVMSAIVVLESGHKLTEVVTITDSSISMVPDGYSTAELIAGEDFTVDELLQAMLIPSANDAAFVLAEYISGSVEAFVEAMNKKALELGCIGTHFTNPCGAHSDDHYSTAYDLYLMASYAMKIDTFKKIVNRSSCSLHPTDFYPYEYRNFKNTNSLIISSSADYYPYAIGIKTGYTTEAQNCLIAAAAKDDIELISVVLGAAYDSSRFQDSIKLFDFGFKNHCYRKMASKGDVITEIEIKNAKSGKRMLNVECEEDIIAFSESSSEEILPEIVVDQNVRAPISKGDIVGTIKYTVLDKEYSANLVAANDVEVSTLLIKMIGIGLVILTVIIIIILISTGKSKKEPNEE